MSDVDVIDDLVFGLLEAAARKLCVPSWPTASPPAKSPDVPVIEARRDDDGALGVFRFATVVDDTVAPRPHFEISLAEAKDLDDGFGVGDEVGVELPLHVVCAIALADLDAEDAIAVADRAGDGGADDDAEAADTEADEDLALRLEKSGLKSAVIARLTLLRGPPPSSPELSELRALVTRHGGKSATPGAPWVRWTMSVAATHDAGDDDEPLPNRLVCCIEHDAVSRLVVIDAVRGPVPRKRLLAAMSPPAALHSLWHLLAEEGPALFNCGEAGLGADKDGARVGVVVTAVDIDAGRDVAGHYGQVTVHSNWTRTRDGRLLSERVLTSRVEVDAGALLDVVDAAGRARLQAAASVFHKRLSARLSDDVDDVFVGAAVLRVLARAARGTALVARANTELGVAADEDDGGFTVDAYGRSLRLVPADDALLVEVKGAFVVVASRSAASGVSLIDGDVEAFRAVCAAIADAIEGSEADAELIFVDEDVDEEVVGAAGAATERTSSLSLWLREFAEADVVGWLPPDAAAARAFQEIADVLTDER